jgi:DNA-binding LacI/PurR family transcriptional regulator
VIKIAFIVNDIHDGYQQLIWSGIQQAATDLGIQVVTLPGRHIRSALKEDLPHNLLYDLMLGKIFDGYVISPTTFSSRDAFQLLNDLYLKPAGKPYVSIGIKMLDEPTVFVDNHTGLYHLATHFVRDHSYHDIGFIRGPSYNPEAEARFETFKEVLAENKLSLRMEWIPEGNFEYASGYEGAKKIWSAAEKPRALLAANDNMLLGAFEFLQEKGVSVPIDIALGGFDDIAASRFNSVPLSTVRQPIFEQAYQAVELLCKYINDRRKPGDITLDTKPLYRESCGCLSRYIDFAGGAIPRSGTGEPGSPITDRVSLMIGSAMDLDLSDLKDPGAVATIWRELSKTLGDPDGAGQREFFASLSRVLSVESGNISHLHLWSSILSAMLKINGEESSPEMQKRGCALIQKCYVMIAEKIDQVQEARNADQAVQFTALQKSMQRIMEAYDMEEFLRRLSEELERMNFKSFFLTFFDSDLKTTANWKEKLPESSSMRLMVHNGKILDHTGISFQSRRLLPESVFGNEESMSLLVQMIVYDDQPVGLMISDSGALSNDIYESLRSQISSSIRAGNLINYMVSTQEHLKKRNAEIENVVFPMLDSIRNVTSITDANLGAMENTVRDIGENRITFQKTADSVESIAESARYMMDLIKMIDDISERINILSINASIESARAGQHGKGFGVIAGEVRKLADSTADNAAQTGDTLKKVVENIKESKTYSDQSQQALNRIQEEIRQLSGSLQAIQRQMSALEEQSNSIMGIIRK